MSYVLQYKLRRGFHRHEVLRTPGAMSGLVDPRFAAGMRSRRNGYEKTPSLVGGVTAVPSGSPLPNSVKNAPPQEAAMSEGKSDRQRHTDGQKHERAAAEVSCEPSSESSVDTSTRGSAGSPQAEPCPKRRRLATERPHSGSSMSEGTSEGSGEGSSGESSDGGKDERRDVKRRVGWRPPLRTSLRARLPKP